MKKWIDTAHCDPETQPHCRMCLKGEWRNQSDFYELPDECPHGLTLEKLDEKKTYTKPKGRLRKQNTPKAKPCKYAEFEMRRPCCGHRWYCEKKSIVVTGHQCAKCDIS